MTSAVDNRRLAKNTMVLYFRMLFQMAVFFYISRVIIRVLGVVDYGVYDVVAGLVVVMMFLNNAMTTSSQRFITVALGKSDKEYLNKIYSACIMIHGGLALLVLLLSETAGLWYMHHYMNIPPERFESALWVFHSSLFSAMILVFNVPFNAAIIAYERMTAFAFINIFDTLCKLGIVLALPYCDWGDKLQAYAVMLLVENLVARSLYIYYCRRNFRNMKFVWHTGKEVFRQIFSFVGWNSLTNTALVCNTQGINLLLNFIGGPVVNAGRGVAVSVQSAITAFVSSFQTAVYPQITKSYAQGDIKNMVDLVSRSSRLSFCLLLILAVPILIETPSLLSIWLTNVPPYAVAFTRLLVCVSLVDAFANPLMVGAAATGRVKLYYSIEGGMLLSALPLACLIARLGFGPEAVFVVHLCVVFATQCVRVFLCHNLYALPRSEYFVRSMARGITVLLAALTLPCLTHHYILPDKLWLHFANSLLAALWTVVCIVGLGLENKERNFILSKIKSMAGIN